MMVNIGITPEEWNALSAGRTATLDRVPGDSKDAFKAGDRLAVHKLFQRPTAEVTVERVVSHDEGRGFKLEVSGFRMLAVVAYGGGSQSGGEMA